MNNTAKDRAKEKKTLFKPNALATGIGSLPHQDPREACKLVWEYLPHIPFWPQLPKRSSFENMYRQYSEGMPAIVEKGDGGFFVDEKKADFYDELERFYQTFLSGEQEAFRISREYAAGIYEWMEGEQHLKSAVALKGQITGPISFGLQVTQSDKRALLYNETLREVTGKLLLRKAQWQVSWMKSFHPQTIIFLDEPYLSAFGSAFTAIDRDAAISAFEDIIAEIDGLTGIHCCGNTDWSLVLDTSVDILSFDAYSYMYTLFIYEESLRKFLDRGGIIAWGIVPTDESALKQESAERLFTRLRGGLERLSSIGFDMRSILAQSLITPSCGLGTLSVEAAQTAFSMTRQLSNLYRDTFNFS